MIVSLPHSHSTESRELIALEQPLNAEPVFVVLRYKHQRMSIITNALTYTWKTKQ